MLPPPSVDFFLGCVKALSTLSSPPRALRFERDPSAKSFFFLHIASIERSLQCVESGGLEEAHPRGGNTGGEREREKREKRRRGGGPKKPFCRRAQGGRERRSLAGPSFRAALPAPPHAISPSPPRTWLLLLPPTSLRAEPKNTTKKGGRIRCAAGCTAGTRRANRRAIRRSAGPFTAPDRSRRH